MPAGFPGIPQAQEMPCPGQEDAGLRSDSLIGSWVFKTQQDLGLVAVPHSLNEHL